MKSERKLVIYTCGCLREMHLVNVLVTMYLSCLLTLISSPSLFDFDAISADDLEKRVTHAFNLATTSYGVPPLFESKGKEKRLTSHLK